MNDLVVVVDHQQLEREQRDARLRDWVRACLVKRKFETVREARRAANRRGREHGLRLGVYPCHHCDGYHLSRRAPE